MAARTIAVIVLSLLGHSTAEAQDRVAQLVNRIESGAASLAFEPPSGYLSALLRELQIPLSSQILVYTKTSFQKGRISPRTPRAIYFGDDVYVAWVQEGPALEISAVDPNLGAVFYTLRQDESRKPVPERQTYVCLQCHDSRSMSGGGFPRHLMGSGIPGPTGRLVSHEGWSLTDQGTPIERRWGGWYVTGKSGEHAHRGNVIARSAAAAAALELAPSDLPNLEGLVDTELYLGKHSDIVALLVAEHQIHVQNLITRAGWEMRKAREAGDIDVETIAEPLVRAMLFSGEVPLEGPIVGSSGFAEEFVARGPFDDRGRSLRELDLERRLFRYPLSYLVYSEAFDALPDPIESYVYRRWSEVLTGEDDSAPFSHLSFPDRKAILEILDATKRDFRAK